MSEKDRYFSKEEYDNFKLKISNIWSNEHSKINIESNFFLRACYRLKRWDELSLVNDLIEPLSKTSEGYIQLASICMTHVVTSDGESYNQFNMDGFQFLLQNEDLQISEVRDYVEENKDSSPERASEVLCAIGLSEEF
ncbi:MAG: hypothetical protein HOJ34_05875 [Kordiimonadaceae bacterium]|nr:hypothetical protein [Kordiimonadaceae bacterium]MBT6037097.1 hypothetical protein [Kordiimonadaceae bacterium]MBT6329294.1 hypothetical protein [Kordiimonadaceae bacterium]